MPISQLPPSHLVQQKLLFSVAPPAIATAFVFALGAVATWLVFGVWRKWSWRKAVPSLAVLSLAAGLLVVPYLNARVQDEQKSAKQSGNPERVQQLAEQYPFQETFPLVPEGKWWHWGLLAVGLALAVEFAVRIPGVPVTVGHLFRGAAAGVIASAVLPPGWQQGADRWTLPLTAGLVAVQWGMLDAVSRRNPGGTLAACLALVAGGVACVAIHDETALFTDFATFLAAALGVLAVGGWVSRSETGSAAAVAVVPVVTTLLMIRDGVPPYEPEWMKHPPVPTAAYWLVGLAPLMLGVFLIPPVTRFGLRWYSVPVKLALVLIPVGIAVYLCVTGAPLEFNKETWE